MLSRCLLFTAFSLFLFGLASCGTPAQKLRWFRTGVYETDLHDFGGLFVPPPSSSFVASPPSGAASYMIKGAFGEYKVQRQGPSKSIQNALWIPSTNKKPFFVAETPARLLEIPGFLYGVDLRHWKRVVFALHLDPEMCQVIRSPSLLERVRGRNPPTQMDFLTRQAALAIQGMPSSSRLFFLAGAGLMVVRFTPQDSPAGRRLASQWITQQFCMAGRSLIPLMRRAFDLKPDLVVLISEFGEIPEISAFELQKRYPDTYRQKAQEYQNLWDLLPRWKPSASLLTVSWRSSNAARTLAEMTGGASVAHHD